MKELFVARFLETLGRLSAQAAVLVLLVWLAQWLFRRWLTPRWRCALWFLVVGRLLLPVSLPTRVSVFNLAPAPPGGKGIPSPQNRLAAAAQAERIAPAELEMARTQFVPTPGEGQPGATAEAPGAALATSPAATAPGQATAPARVPAPVWRFSWPLALFLVWLTGAGTLLLHVVVNSVRMARRFRGWRAVTDPEVLAVLDQGRARMRVATRLRLLEGAEVRSPALHGVFRPRLLLPVDFTRTFTSSELHFVFLHELAHVKRRDVLMNWIVALLQIVHWFNPLVWYGFARWRADRELACDALALEAAGEGTNKEYGRTILRLLESFAHRVGAPGWVGIMEDRRQLQRRIGMIAGFVPARRWSLLAVALLAGLAVVGLTDAQAPRPKTRPPTAAAPSPGEASKKEVPPREERRGADPLLALNETNVPAQALTLIVLDATNGRPIAEAEIDTPFGDGRTAPPRRLTDAEGRYVLQMPLPPPETRARTGNLNFRASHPDYASRAVAWTSSGGDAYAIVPKEVRLKLEKGIPIGGVVRDANGKPLAGVKVLVSGSAYRGFNLGTGEKKDHEYAQVYCVDTAAPAAVTDNSGRWTLGHFPSELEKFEITFVRPDESRESFSTGQDHPLNARPLVELQELKKQTALFSLPGGVTVRGRVVDESGRPVAGALVKEGYGHGNIQRISEFVTGKDGRFECPNRAPRQWIYTATGEGCATVSVVAQVQEGMSEVKIVLPPAKPIRIRVVDETGQPLAGTTLQLDSYRNPAQILDWAGTTDAEGRAVWTNAPTALVTFYALADGRVRKFKAAAGDTEQQVVIAKNPATGAKARLKAFDRESGAPVLMQSVSANINGEFNSKILGQPLASEYTAEIRQSEVTVGNYGNYTLIIMAEGYEPFTSREIDLDEGDQDVPVPMTRGGGPAQLAVLLPDGTPAAGARVWVRPNDNAGAVFANAPHRYYGDRWEKAQVNAGGEVKLPPAPAKAPLIIAHTNGFLETSLGALGQSREIKLQPWGRVEGCLLIAGRPTSGVKMALSDLIEPFHLIYNDVTREDGSFVFTNVPAGEYTIYRRYNNRMGSITPSHQMPITVKAGEALKLDYAFTGRAVIGQALTEPPDLAADWLNDTHVLTLKAPPGRAQVNREDFATFEAFRAANDLSFTSSARRQNEREARNYELIFERDGAFRVDDVPPGTYQLLIKITKPNQRGRFTPSWGEEPLGSLTREVVVPAGVGPFDLGSIAVPMKDGEPARRTAPMSFQAQTLDGTEVNLANFHGKHLLVVFWAAWSQRHLEQLAELKKLQAEFGREDRLAFLSLNLDDDVATARQASEALGRGWNLARLDGRARTDVTAAFNVETLPALFLLDPDGRVVSRDLEGERTRATVARVLKKK